MRRVSVRFENLGCEPKIGIWGVRRGKEEDVVVAAVRTVGGRIDPERVRGGNGEIIVSPYPNPGSLQRKIVGALKEALPDVNVRGKTKIVNMRAT